MQENSCVWSEVEAIADQPVTGRLLYPRQVLKLVRWKQAVPSRY